MLATLYYLILKQIKSIPLVRYVRITHEDLSLHPIETAKMLYTFVDLEWTASTEEYIRNTTTGTRAFIQIPVSKMFKIFLDYEWKMQKNISDQLHSS